MAKQKLKEHFRTGQSLFVQGTALAPSLEEMLHSMLEGEIKSHPDNEERESGNRKNRKTK